MNKLLVLSTDKLVENKIKRIVKSPIVFNDEPINFHVILRFLNQERPKLLIIHQSINCVNLSIILDYLMTNKVIPVIYIHKTTNFSTFYHVLNDSFFAHLEENKIDIALPVIIEVLAKVSEEIKTINNKLVKLETKLKDTKIMNQAKFLLMEINHYSEEEAHKYLIQEAMNQRKSKEQVAEEIIKKLKNSLTD